MADEGENVVRLAIASARDPQEPGGGGGGGGGLPPEDDEHGGFRLPEGSPVTPLGVAGEVYYYVDGLSQLRALKDSEHNRLRLGALFARDMGYLYEHFSTVAERSNKVRVDWDIVATVLMVECSRRGIWDVSGRLRGGGAWRGDNDELILHCGNQIAIRAINEAEEPEEIESLAPRWERPGRVGRHVYAAEPPLPRPGDVSADRKWGRDVLDLFRHWNFRRDIDAELLLGWVAAGMLAGALKWRPSVWILGAKGTGKSSLQTLLMGLFDEAIIDAVDTTGAGIWQAVRHKALPIMVDELEPEQDNRRAEGVVKLARVAASGGRIRRGGDNHQGQDFTMRSPFLFSSILMPPLGGADISRLAILKVEPIREGQKEPRPSHGELAGLGRMLRRRLWDRWPAVDGAVMAYNTALRASGHTARAADQFGTLLALADVLLTDGAVDAERVAKQVRQVAPETLAETSEDVPLAEQCLNHLLTKTLSIWRNGARRPVSSLIWAAAGFNDADGESMDTETAANELQTVGLKMLRYGVNGERALAVANYHQGLGEIFRGSKWAGRDGTMGVWVQALRELPGASAAPSSLRFSGAAIRCTLIPLALIFPDDSRGRAEDQ